MLAIYRWSWGENGETESVYQSEQKATSMSIVRRFQLIFYDCFVGLFECASPFAAKRRMKKTSQGYIIAL